MHFANKLDLKDLHPNKKIYKSNKFKVLISFLATPSYSLWSYLDSFLAENSTVKHPSTMIVGACKSFKWK